jgi:hypothetical protein
VDFPDLLGVASRLAPKLGRRSAYLSGAAVGGLAGSGPDVRTGAFPSDAESYHLADDVAELLGLYGSS